MRIKSVLRCEENRRKVFVCMSFPNLNLPPITLRTRPGANGRPTVWDVLRRRYVTLTAEEWVRQHFVHYLIAECGYPAGLLANEIALDVGGVRRRCDTVLFAREGARPRVIVEYKAPQVPITQEVFNQIQSYNSVLKADYLIVSNGLLHYCCRMDYEGDRVIFLREIPRFEELI